MDDETPRDLITRIDALVSPVAIEHALATHHRRLELFRRRFEHTLGDLALFPHEGITVALAHGRITIETASWRSAEALLRTLDHHADHHELRSLPT